MTSSQLYSTNDLIQKFDLTPTIFYKWRHQLNLNGILNPRNHQKYYDDQSLIRLKAALDQQAEQWTLLQISKYFQVDRRTFVEWLKNHDELYEGALPKTLSKTMIEQIKPHSKRFGNYRHLYSLSEAASRIGIKPILITQFIHYYRITPQQFLGDRHKYLTTDEVEFINDRYHDHAGVQIY